MGHTLRVLERVGRNVRGVAHSVNGRRFGPHALLFVVALAVRVVWVLVVERNSFVLNDAAIYNAMGVSINEGLGFRPMQGGVSAQWPPGYGVVLAGVYFVFGNHPVAGELTNAFLGALTVVLLVVLVERLFGRRPAIIAGVWLALMPGPILWTDVLVSETTFTMLFVLLFVLLAYGPLSAGFLPDGRVRPARLWPWLVAVGLVIGVAANVRGEAVTWGLLPIVYFWRAVPWRTLAMRVAVIGLVACLALAPWTIRNAVRMGAFIPTGTNASHTLWSGHNPGATGGQTYPPADYFDRFTQTSPERELESAAALRSDAIEFMLSHPLRELELIPLKLIHLNRGDSYAFDWINAVPAGESPPVAAIDVERIGVIADAAYFALLACTIAAAVVFGRRLWRERTMRCVAASFCTALFLYGFMYYGNYRYRLPFEPLMIVVSTVLVNRVWTHRADLANNLSAPPCRPPIEVP
jgi:4-amino-4-deoxy-L-arabinose transferase-like glycosyltransferase